MPTYAARRFNRKWIVSFKLDALYYLAHATSAHVLCIHTRFMQHKSLGLIEI